MLQTLQLTFGIECHKLTKGEVDLAMEVRLGP
jgi:hypothetical protein